MLRTVLDFLDRGTIWKKRNLAIGTAEQLDYVCVLTFREWITRILYFLQESNNENPRAI